MRVDSLKFFVTLMEKIFKVRQLELLEARHCLDTTNDKVSDDAVQFVQSLADVMGEIADCILGKEDEKKDYAVGAEEADDTNRCSDNRQQKCGQVN